MFRSLRIVASGLWEKGRRRPLTVLAVLLLVALDAWILHWVLGQGVHIRPDSKTYINGVVYRTAGYPVTIAVFEKLFGDGGLQALVVFQALFGILAANVLGLFLRRRFGLPWWIVVPAVAFLLLPYRNLHVGNRIMTEGLAYPLVLFAFRYLAGGLADRRDRDFVVYFACVVAGVLVRPQMLFFHVVSILAVAFVAAVRRPWIRNRLLVAALLSSFVAAPATDRVYRWIRHGSAKSVPFTGIQVIAGALYLAQPEDAALWSGRQAEFFTRLYQAVAAQKLLPPKGKLQVREHLFGFGPPLYEVDHWAWGYNRMTWQTARVVAMEYVCQDCDEETQFIEIDALLTSTAFTLMRHRPEQTVRFYFSTVLAGVYPHERLLLLAVLAASLRMGLYRRHDAALVLAAVLLAHGANLCLIGTVEPVLERYRFYTETVVPVFVVVFLFVVATGRGEPSRCAESPAT